MQDERLRPALREAALRQSSKTYVELLNFIGEHGEYPRTQRLLHPDIGNARRASASHHHGVH
ncbi:hypothetical protein V5O39_19120 [Pseudomonas parakoreensis]